jgi:conjugative transposon TraM protein
MNLRQINWKQPKYMLPAIIYIPLLATGYFVIDIFHTETAEVPSELETTEYLNAELPKAQLKGDAIVSKRDAMERSFGQISDFSAVEGIEQDDDKPQTEDYDSKYSDEDLAFLDADAAQRTAELEASLQERLRQSAEKGKAIGDGEPPSYSEDDRLARHEVSQAQALAELEEALAKARLAGTQKADGAVNDITRDEENLANRDTMHTGKVVSGTIEVNGKAVTAPSENEEAGQMVKKVRTSSSYFNTIADVDAEPNLIKAIIDEDIKAVDGSRVRLRLLDDVEINETVVKKGTYIYAIMSGFGGQRVKGTIKSLLVDDRIVKVNLSLYDTDGLEGLYVPQSSFRETTKDVASSSMGGSMSINDGGTGNSLSQWGMQAVQQAYSKTSNAISKAIRKNKAKLKYGTFVYLVNGNNKDK